MDIRTFKRRLKELKEIHITPHALIRAEQRQINLKEVKQNLKNPERLIMVKEEPESDKYTCWFQHSKSLGHRYTMLINAKTKVVTVIKIRSRWQREVEKHAKKIPRRLRL